MPTQFINLGNGDNTITPLPADDDYFINGGNGNNTVTLGNGADAFTLGDGNNTLTVGDGTDEFALGGGNNSVTTGNGDSDITVGDGNNTITVGTGSNAITLGAGLNTVHTGAGNNVVSVSAAALSADTIMGALTSGDGSTNRIVLTTAGTMSPVNVSGFQSYQLANGGPNSLTLSEGNFARLPGGSITVAGGDAGDTVNASALSAAHAVVINSGAGIDNLTGGAGADRLNGGAGNDYLAGNGGNDVYYVDSAADQVIEAVGGGTDRVIASASYVLKAGQEVERLDLGDLAGTAALNLTGNEFANTIYGNAANNTLNGGGGTDYLSGLLGDDLYYVDNAGDKVIEAAGGGYDRIIASVNYVLKAGQEVERLDMGSFAGTAALNLTGNEFANIIYGNAANNRLSGSGGDDSLSGNDGNDTLNGGTGNDRLTGGIGQDRFLFDSPLDPATNLDRVFDFNSVDEKVLLAGSVFSAAGAPGTLAVGAFRSGAAAADADDRIIYNSANGALSYDSDGTGAVAAVQFATLNAGLALNNTHFTIT